MICPRCLHPNPESQTVCRHCRLELPAIAPCSTCGTSVQADANFCGQCGSLVLPSVATPDLPTAALTTGLVSKEKASPNFSLIDSQPIIPTSVLEQPDLEKPESSANRSPSANRFQRIPLPLTPRSLRQPPGSTPPGTLDSPSSARLPRRSSAGDPSTQLQNQQVYLLHVQTNVAIELPSHTAVIHIGKPNDRIPPDIDVAGFPNSEVVSRVHADIRVEGDSYFIEDVGSANGTYVNNLSLPAGNRHRLRPGDRLSLGKGDLISFLFQIE